MSCPNTSGVAFHRLPPAARKVPLGARAYVPGRSGTVVGRCEGMLGSERIRRALTVLVVTLLAIAGPVIGPVSVQGQGPREAELATAGPDPTVEGAAEQASLLGSFTHSVPIQVPIF